MVVVVDVFREKPYAIDVYYDGTNVYGDVVFVDESFIDHRLEKV